MRLEDFLHRLASDEGAPGGGSAAALTVSFAASLVAMVARGSRDSWSEGAGIAAQALALQKRAAHLSRTDAEAWQDALEALERAGSGRSGDASRDFELEGKLDLAAAIPLEIAELGATAATLAALTAEHGNPTYRADAAAAAALAAGGARAAAHLVEVNLAVREGEDRLLRARASEETAGEAAERVRELIR